ncbi:MAG TPA: molybdopterin-dependent oxidoreductase [Longimicrobiales bacterium]|nr:molybdopterin-dependent oxidoreductase [Longimicrobiales bacterium]
MTRKTTRRDMLKESAALAGLGILGLPEWAFPALAQEETLVPFTDLPETITLERTPDRRIIDVRTIRGVLTPSEQFFTTQHYGHPEIDLATYRLQVSGLVDRPLSLSLEDLRSMPSRELVFGFECSGNRGPVNGLCSNGRWRGVPLRAVMERAGLRPEAREVVLFGADHGEEDVEFRGNTFTVDQHYGRSLQRDQALSDGPLLAYSLNDEPLTTHQGRPLRLLVPGWYGAPNVKWVSEIHVQEDQYLGKYQARWYRTLKGEMVNGEMQWKETAITKMRLKSFIARVTRATADGSRHNVFGVVLHDGTPIRSVEVRVDDGPWQPATMDPATTGERYGWKFFNYTWNNAAPGEHTVTSRATDADGYVQPTAEELEVKQTFLEHNAQLPRTLVIT